MHDTREEIGSHDTAAERERHPPMREMAVRDNAQRQPSKANAVAMAEDENSTQRRVSS